MTKTNRAAYFCWDLGYTAHSEGLPRSMCPFAEDTVQWQDWIAGWESFLNDVEAAATGSASGDR